MEIEFELEIPSKDNKKIKECKFSLDLYAVKNLYNRVMEVNYFILK